LDKAVFDPSTLPPLRRTELQNRFHGMLSRLPGGRDYQLEFRNAPKIGANAFALPSGTVVMTDDLVGVAKHDEEVLAVLAHELGHLEHRHSLRAMLQDSVTGLILLAVTGDASSVLALGATAMIDGKYSREFETEADDYAFDFLHRAGIATHFFADILNRMETSHAEDSRIIAFLATHPLTKDRIRRFQQP
jgi:predicted Zn-dependent protease